MHSVSLRRVLHKFHDIRVGEYSYGAFLDPTLCRPGVMIGRYVSIGPGSRRYCSNHPLQSGGLHPFNYDFAFGYCSESDGLEKTRLVVGHDAWIGANVVVLPSVERIGIGAVIGAGSIVTKDVPDFAVVAGNPARILRLRFSDSQIERLLLEAPWERSPSDYVSSVRRLNLGD